MKNNKSNSVRRTDSDIIKLILTDHIPLKKLIKTLIDTDIKFSEKKPSFEKFATQLLAHAKPEAESLYARLKEGKGEMRLEGFEGETEHDIAENLIEEIRQTEDRNEWLAKVKVLGELVRHHIEEEEGEMFKVVKREFDTEDRVDIGEEYLQLKQQFEADMQIAGKRSRSGKNIFQIESTL